VGVKKIIGPPYTQSIMPKSLGQIHTVNKQMIVSASGNKLNIDLPGQLTEQLQRLVRAGTYHKVVGIDMDITTVGITGGGQITGRLQYYAPTSGRCDAFRSAFQSMKEVMKTQGLNMHENKLYDFRAPINDDGTTEFFPNQATLDGTNGLCLNNVATPGASIFGVHNESVRPQFTQAAGDAFKTGFDTILSEAYTNATGNIKTDFVLNDAVPYTGNHNVASTDYESIPFSLSYTPDSTDLTLDLQWRPDPALFLAVMCGQLQVVVEEVNFDGGAEELELNIAVMVSGWKSIMGEPKKRNKSRKE
jgi:hypothetical protein